MIRNVVNWSTILLSFFLILAACVWFWMEGQWAAWDKDGPSSTPKDAFVHGPIGLEVFPLKYAAVLDRVSRHAFLRDPEDARSVWEVYGFLPNRESQGRDPCAAHAAQELPHGFAISDYLPLSAIETPVAFVGFTCAACHSGRIRHADGIGPIIDGMGNPELDVIGFSDAVRTAVLDPDLTVDRILREYQTMCPADSAGPIMDFVERQIIAAWLGQFRETVATEIGRYGPPRWPHGNEVHSPDTARHLLEPAGPGRTRPFRSVVRVTLALPGVENMAFSKIPAVFEQRSDLRPRSQYDGSIRDTVTRSFIAAYASGATPTALAKPEVARSIRQAAAFTETLGIEQPLPVFAARFPALAPDPEALAAGRAIYRQYCMACHGDRNPETGAWVAEGARLHEVMTVEEIGTDPQRVVFPNGPTLPLSLWTALPAAGSALEAQKRRLREAQEAAVAERRFAEARLWSDQLARLNLNARRFRLGHPLSFAECTGATCDCAAESRIGNAPIETRRSCALTAELGYINNPIPGVWLRAPYLHNGAVPTMRQLLNAEDRPRAFCRGADIYDPQAMGYAVLITDDPADCPADRSFLFDTAQPGNANTGHDYPWPRRDVRADPAKQDALQALIIYLRTL